jgi:prepilin-type N-terminal cleavage/methylation domain-containing protein
MMQRTNRRQGFTLLEMLVAMIILAIITLATSFSLSTSLIGYDKVQAKAEDMQEARALFRTLSNDLRAAYVSEANPHTMFIATGEQSGTLLTFSTLANRIAVDPNGQATSATDQAYLPQSDLAVVSYSFDPTYGEVHRVATAVPNADTLPQPGQRGSLVAQRIQSITFEFVDPNQGLLTNWDLEVQDPATAAATGTSTAGSTDTQATSAITSTNTQLPQAIRITATIVRRAGATTFSTTIPLLNTVPQPKGQAPAAATTPTTPGGGGGGN